MLRLTPPTHRVFYISVALAIISVALGALIVLGISNPFHTGGYLILLVGYLVLLPVTCSKERRRSS
jgi:hypothetical protein